MSYQGTITSKGQTTIPKEVRKKLKLKPGDRIYWILEDDQAFCDRKPGPFSIWPACCTDPDKSLQQ